MFAEITRVGIFAMQVCVPKDWSDEQIVEFAEKENPAGTSAGWHVRKGDRVIEGDLERQPCEKRENCVHVCLDV